MDIEVEQSEREQDANFMPKEIDVTPQVSPAPTEEILEDHLGIHV